MSNINKFSKTRVRFSNRPFDSNTTTLSSSNNTLCSLRSQTRTPIPTVGDLIEANYFTRGKQLVYFRGTVVSVAKVAFDPTIKVVNLVHNISVTFKLNSSAFLWFTVLEFANRKVRKFSTLFHSKTQF